jgi:surface antigen
VTDHPTYALGQCTRYVADTWDGGPIGPYWGDGWQWLNSAALAGYLITHVPLLDAIAVWGPNQGGAGAAGHVAIVTSVNPLTVRESNWTAALTADVRVVAHPIDVTGYIIPRETPVPISLDLARGVVLLYYFNLRDGWTAAQADVDYWAARMMQEGVETVLNLMNATPEASAERARSAAIQNPTPPAGS